MFLLAGRKRKKCRTSTYLLSTDPTDLCRAGRAALASLRSNLLGTAWRLGGLARQGPDLACVLYQPNVLGLAGPRRMTVLLPSQSRHGDTRYSGAAPTSNLSLFKFQKHFI